MSALLALAIGLGLGLVQLGAAPPLFGEPQAAPLLPIAVAAGWSAAREAGAAAPVLLGAAIVLGVASEERAGWFVMATLPAGALFAAAGSASPLRRLAFVPAAAGLGAALYLGLLYLAAGQPALFGHAREDVLAASLWTAALAGAGALLAWPLRPRPPAGLFR
jgi:hypothetical protein